MRSHQKMSAFKRIRKELVDFNKDPPANCSVGLVNDNDMFQVSLLCIAILYLLLNYFYFEFIF